MGGIASKVTATCKARTSVALLMLSRLVFDRALEIFPDERKSFGRIWESKLTMSKKKTETRDAGSSAQERKGAFAATDVIDDFYFFKQCHIAFVEHLRGKLVQAVYHVNQT